MMENGSSLASGTWGELGGSRHRAGSSGLVYHPSCLALLSFSDQVTVTSSQCKHLHGSWWLPHTHMHFGCCCPKSRSGTTERPGKTKAKAMPWSQREEVMFRDTPAQQTHCTFIFMWIFCFVPTSCPGYLCSAETFSRS